MREFEESKTEEKKFHYNDAENNKLNRKKMKKFVHDMQGIVNWVSKKQE